MTKSSVSSMVALLLTGGLALHATATAQSGNVRRVELQRHDLSFPGREVVQVRIEFADGAAFGEHWHPGEEIINVLEGVLEYRIEGRESVILRAGDVLFIPARTVHSARNVSTGTGVELATYVVEKKAPLVVLVR